MDAVDAATDALGPFAGDLVTHRVGQRLDRRRTREPVAVPVQELMQLAQCQRPVPAEDGQAGRPKTSAAQQVGT
jgi:hypothetical protein